MPSTYDLIATNVVSGTPNTVTLSSIPSTYTHLRLVWRLLTNANANTYIQFNTVGGTDYSSTVLSGNGTSAASSRTNADYDLKLSATDNANNGVINLYTFDIFNYAGSTNKTFLITWSNDKNGSGSVVRQVGLWRSTAAINQIKLESTGAMVSGTSVSLYGIKKA